MDSQYYRKILPKSIIPAPIRKLFKSNWTWVFLFAGTFVVSYTLYNTKGFLQHLHLRKERQEIQDKLAAAQQEQMQLRAYSKALESDPKVIEKVAREKYGMIREGEIVYKVRKQK